MSDAFNIHDYFVIEHSMGTCYVINWKDGWIGYTTALVHTRFQIVKSWGLDQEEIQKKLKQLNDHHKEIIYNDDIGDLKGSVFEPTLEQLEAIIHKMQMPLKKQAVQQDHILLDNICMYLELKYNDLIKSYQTIALQGERLYHRAKENPQHMFNVLDTIKKTKTLEQSIELNMDF